MEISLAGAPRSFDLSCRYRWGFFAALIMKGRIKMTRHDPSSENKKLVEGAKLNYVALLGEMFEFNGFSFLLDSDEYTILPGFCDVHVHFREPGFSYKETIRTGSKAAARGGYTDVCTMPNLNPVPDSVENLKAQLDIIKKDAVINVHPYGAITVGEKGEILSDMDGMANNVIAFSDDGRGVQREEMMHAAMEKAKSLGKIIAAHCEVNELLNGGYIHDGEYAKTHGHRGISSESEWRQIERDIELSKKTGCSYHVCHISTAESVELIRKAKADGVDITCETAPHYLVLDDSNIYEDGRYKMNPPLRSKRDKEALIAGVLDGTIDMIATDHAPHLTAEKAKGLEFSTFGVVGLETAFPVMYTHFVKTGILTLEKLLMLMSIAPRERFNIGMGPLDVSVWNLNKAFAVDSAKFVSMGKATPFEGMELYGKCVATFCGEKLRYKDLPKKWNSAQSFAKSVNRADIYSKDFSERWSKRWK